MRNLYVAIGLALCSASALSADFGVGVSARSDDGMLYLPVDVTPSLRIEPSVRYASSKQSFSGGNSLDSETLEVGAGVFGLLRVTEAAHVYFGGRFSYIDSKTTSINRLFSTVSRTETDQDGYRAGPTLGVEYVFGQHFSVGGEASYLFADLDSETNETFSSGPRKGEDKGEGTQTRLIFRYMF